MNTLQLQIDNLELRNRSLQRDLEIEKKNSNVNMRMYTIQMEYYHRLYTLMQEYIIGEVTDDVIQEVVDNLDNELEVLMLQVIKEGEK